MTEKFSFMIVSSDEIIREQYAGFIRSAGYEVMSYAKGAEAFEFVLKHEPDCVICDLTKPDVDTLELFQKIRKKIRLYLPVMIAMTNCKHLSNTHRELEVGADAYIDIPIQSDVFLRKLLEHLRGKVVVDFWGCRGTLTVPGRKSVIYGGNTSCITLSFSNRQLLIFDAGTGFKELSNYLMQRNRFPIKAKLFITHPHYDHICGIPYFAPLYSKENEFEILGPDQRVKTLDQVISGQMDRVYFPVVMKEMLAKIQFHSLDEETFEDNDITVRTMLLNHPGRCLGYRIDYQGKSICYITDNELYLENSPCYHKENDDKLIEFIKRADVLIMDATYTDAEYEKKIGWGHSCISRVVSVAHQAEVKFLCLHHHDPDQTDTDIDRKFHQAIELLKALHSKTQCIAPHEGDRLVI